MSIMTLVLILLALVLVIPGKVRRKVPWSLWVFISLSVGLFWVFGHYYTVKPEEPWHLVAIGIWIAVGLYVLRNINRPNRTIPFIVFMVAALMGIAILTDFFFVLPAKPTTTAPNNSPTTKSVYTPPPVLSPVLVDKIMEANKFKKSEYKISNDVDKSKDESTAGDGPVFEKGVKNPKEMVALLKSNEDNSPKLLKRLEVIAQSNKEELTDPRNWCAVQILTPFGYAGNTAMKNGDIVDVGTKEGLKNEIILMFVSPTSFKMAIVRSGCANPQTKMIVKKIVITKIVTREKIVIKPITKVVIKDKIITKVIEKTHIIVRHRNHEDDKDVTKKDPTQNVLRNPAVADWKKDDPTESLHTINNGDGAKVSNGLQSDPKADAIKAEEAAKVDDTSDKAAADTARQQAVNTGAGVDNTTHQAGTVTLPD